GKTGVKSPAQAQAKGTVGGQGPGLGTPPGTGLGTPPGTGSGTVGAQGHASRRPAAGSALRTPANGECLLYSFLAGAPQLVRDRLPGLAATAPGVFAWLSDTAGVRADVHAQATALSYTGALPPHPPSQAAVAALRTFIANYLRQTAHANQLPDQVVLQLRASVADEFGRHLRLPTTSRADLLALAQRYGVANTAALTDNDLRDALESVYLMSTAPPSAAELQGLLTAVGNWETSWASDHGDAFLVLTAHALGLAVDVAQPDQFGGPPTVFDCYGPPGGPVVEVHDSPAHRHDWGSDAIPAPAPVPVPLPAPVLNPAPVPAEASVTAPGPAEDAEAVVHVPEAAAPPGADELV
ncbi:hypothetical protein O1W17_42540, partial [Streptomyces sp. H34-S5]|nr:hypothetical protein [Streptomyces sp. H34-S5]